MLLVLVIGWLLTVSFLVAFFRSSADVQQLLFLGSLGAPLMMPLAMLILTVLVFLQ